MIEFIILSIFLGIGLAMDAFSVSLTNGLNDNKMKVPKMCGVAGVYAFFQFVMPMIGWICIHTIGSYFKDFQKWVPWIALIILVFLGAKMIYEAVKGNDDDKEEIVGITFSLLMLQGLATSIDALSVGFTIAHYSMVKALICAGIIAVVTFILCVIGIAIGKVFGNKFSGKASLIGGIILIAVGIEILVKGVFF